ncbi:MAG: ABC transporter ATP-binding protein [Alphaproteobacteria bacterium]|nr:ABC transporter ATP-binding protein [Alphaproteobacteria bacterium]
MNGDPQSAALVFSGVHAGYGVKPVLTGLDLAIGAGEVYALFGPNGAGKSTAARVACGLLEPTRGEVRWPNQGKSGVSLSPQQEALFQNLTVAENLHVIARAAGARRERASIDVARALRLTACETRANELIAVLSGGWRRRASLAAALVGQPSLVVADEPTQGVDVHTRSALANALRAAATEGAACLLISHDARFVEAAADRVGFLLSGRLIKEGKPTALLDEAFGTRRTLAVRFAETPQDMLAKVMREAGFFASADGLTWRRIGDQPFEVARLLADAVNQAGGELIVSRPDLDDLAAALHEERHARDH